MSRTETYRGILRKVQADGLFDLEFYCKIVLEQHGFNGLSSGCKTYTESIYEELDDKFIVLDGGLYEFIEKEDLGEDYFCYMKKNDGGTINFITQFYNGGTCLNEMLEDELIRISNK